MGRIMTVEEVAKYLNLVPNTIYRKARAGEIPAVKVGKCWRFPKQALDKWLNDKAMEFNGFAHVAQSVEHMHGKHVVIGSIPVVGSNENNQ